MNRRATSSVLVAGATLWASVSAQENAPIPTQPTQPQIFRMYVGMDVQVPLGDEYEAVHDYRNKLIRYADQASKLEDLPDIRFSYQTKLGKNSIQISNIEHEQESALARARLEAMRTQQALQDYSARQGEMAMAQQRRQSLTTNDGNTANPVTSTQIAPGLAPTANNATGDPGDPILPDYSDVLAEQAQLNNMLTDSERYEDSIQYGPNSQADRLQVTAEISSPMPISNAYLVGLITYSTDTKSEAQTLVFNRIGALGPEPRRVRIVSQGFRADAEIDDIDLHVFRNGRELVSNLSDKQFSLTRDEALTYLISAYLTENRWGKAPPEPVWDLAPEPLFAATNPDDFDYSFRVDVDATGQVTTIHDPGSAPSYITALVYDMVFYPALDDGDAVAGVAEIDLKDFFQ